jgi:hypothetical protein
MLRHCRQSKTLDSVKAHTAVLRFHKALTLLTLRHRQVSYFLFGHQRTTPWKITIWQRSCQQASWGLPPEGMDRIQSASFQKSRARQKAFLAWEHEFGLERCLAQFKLRWTGDSGEGHAHREKIITEPPSGSNHPFMGSSNGRGKRRSWLQDQTSPLFTPHYLSSHSASRGPRVHGIICKTVPPIRSDRNTSMPMRSSTQNTFPPNTGMPATLPSASQRRNTLTHVYAHARATSCSTVKKSTSAAQLYL